MATDKIVLNLAGFKELRNSAEVSDLVQEAAYRMESAAGIQAGFEASEVRHGARARATVHTTDFASRQQNAREDTLMRALDAGRG